MTAPQNTWAKPLGHAAVDAWRERNVWFIQKNAGSYDPLTGNVGLVPSRIWHCGAAIQTKLQGPHAAYNYAGFDAGTDVTMWFDGTTLPIEPAVLDQVWYQGIRWSVSKVDPLLESDGTFYAYKVIASSVADVVYQGSGPPPLEPGMPPIIESIDWLPGGTAPGQPTADGRPQVVALTWKEQPLLTSGGAAPTGNLPVGSVLNVTNGVVQGGTSPYTHGVQWLRAPRPVAGVSGTVTWTPIPGATGNTYATTQADTHHLLAAAVTAGDNETPPKTLTFTTAPVPVGPLPLSIASLPIITGTVQEGVTLTGTAGTAAGGLAPLHYVTRWEISPDGHTGWAVLPPTDPAHPLSVIVPSGTVGQHIRLVTVATDSDNPASSLTIDGHASASIAAAADVPLVIGTAPTITGAPVVGSTLTATDGTATGGVAPLTATTTWQFSATANGPWTDLPASTVPGNSRAITESEAGGFIRAITTVVDSRKPTPHKVMIPGPPTAVVKPRLVMLTAPGLPTDGLHAGIPWGPVTDATFTGGVPPYSSITRQWQKAPAANGPWVDIAGQTTATIKPDAALVGQFIRLVDHITDSRGVGVDAPSAPTQVGALETLCAGGAVYINRPVPGQGTTAGEPQLGLYCATKTGPWVDQGVKYDTATGETEHQWLDGLNHKAVQVLSPDTQITYSPPKGKVDDWREKVPGTWVNLRTGVQVQIDAWQAVASAAGHTANGYAKGNPINPGRFGYIIEPSPLALRSIETAPQPAPGSWTQLAPLKPGGIPNWKSSDGRVYTQWGDPTVIGVVGAPVSVWLGTGPDPWFRRESMDPHTPAPNYWRNGATGQVWPAGGGEGPAGLRPQPWDTADIAVPPGDTFPTGDTHPTPLWKYWPAAAQPKLDADGQPYHGATPNPGFDPIVQLQASASGGTAKLLRWWNYVERREITLTTKPPFSQWVKAQQVNATIPHTVANANAADPMFDWIRQSDGRYIAAGDNPDHPRGVEADWVEFPAGSGAWYNLTKPEAYGVPSELGGYSQRWNPGRGRLPQGTAAPAGTSGVGIEANLHSCAPAGVPAAWTRTGDGSTASPYTWTNATTGARVTQPMNPGVSGFIGPASTPLLKATDPGAIVGNLQPGSTLTEAHPGSVKGGQGNVTAVLRWQWSANGTSGWADIAGAGGQTTGNCAYTVQAGDVGHHLRVVELWSDSNTPTADTVELFTPSVGPIKANAPKLVGDNLPAITGTIGVGATVQLVPGTSHGGVAPVTHTLRLESMAQGIHGWQTVQTGPGQYTFTTHDLGAEFRVVDVVTDSAVPPQSVTLTGAKVGPVENLLIAGQVRIVPPGAPKVGQQLTIEVQSPARGGKGTIDFDPRWQIAPGPTGPWTNVPGFRSSTYTPVAGDVGKLLHCTAIWRDQSNPRQQVEVVVACDAPVEAAVKFVTDPTGAHHGDGVWTDWTMVRDVAPFTGRPAGISSTSKWTNARTGAHLWQTDNPGVPVPLNAIWDPNFVANYSIGPAAPGGPFVAGGFVWRHPDTFHFDSTHLVWVSNEHPTLVFSQQANSGINPHSIPAPADTGQWVNPVNGWHYGETSAPPTIVWVQTSPGVWQKKVSGANSGAPLHQTDDPTKQPP